MKDLFTLEKQYNNTYDCEVRKKLSGKLRKKNYCILRVKKSVPIQMFGNSSDYRAIPSIFEKGF